MADYNEKHVPALSELKTMLQEVNSTIAKNAGEVNVIEKISVNGEEQSVTEGKKIELTIPEKVSDLNNDSKFQTDTDVDGKIKAQISSVYKPMGSTEFASLPEPGADNLGNVYNISDDFTTNDKFVEGTGKKYPAGTNVAVVNSDGYKFDVLSGMVDLTPYAKTDDITQTLDSNYVKKDGNKKLSTEDYTTAEKNKLAELEYATPEEVQAMLAEVFGE